MRGNQDCPFKSRAFFERQTRFRKPDAPILVLPPDFGNPYNDIGSYLITLRRYEEAIPWLKLDTKGERYESRHFPHHNLGRIYERTGEFQEALRQYQQSLRHQPHYKPALQASERLIAWMN